MRPCRPQERLGGLDILVNNAGISGPNHPLWEYPLEAWRQVVEVNLLGTFYCCRAVVPVMLERGYGRIINIASIAGKEGNPQASAYSASKPGVIGLTNLWARSWPVMAFWSTASPPPQWRPTSSSK